MKLSGAQIVVEALIEQGVDTIFGYPGGQILHIYDELYKNSDRIRHIITAHEQGAAHAADGYARATGKVGVVFATSGPGASNLVTGIATAYLDSVPIVAITGNVPLALLGRDSFQEVDITGITMPITKHNYIVKNVENLAGIIREAFLIAKSGRPGPVLIDIPKDVQINTCEYEPGGALEKSPIPIPDEEEFNNAVDMINKSQKPFIYCGGGVIISNSGSEVQKLSEKISAPIGFSMMGLTAVPGDHPSALGMTGMHGKYASSKAKAEADLIIAIGARFSDRATGDKSKYAKNARIIHIDVDEAEIDKNITADLKMVGDVKKIVGELASKVLEKSRSEWWNEIEALKKEEEGFDATDDSFKPKTIIKRLSEFTGDDTVIVTDVGQHQMWTAQYYTFKKPRTFLTSGGLGTMGFGMGAAIGACVSRGGKRTVLVTGDGSFGMNLTELATAVTNRLPLVVIIMNNSVLGMVRQWQTMFFEKRYSNTLLERRTDFVKLAEAFGAKAFRAKSTEELETAYKAAFSEAGPVVIDCVIDKDEFVLPMIPPGGSIDNIIVK